MEAVITALATRGRALYVGLQDGTITALTRRPGAGGYDRHRLVGHGGSVTARNRPEGGAMVTMILPGAMDATGRASI